MGGPSSPAGGSVAGSGCGAASPEERPAAPAARLTGIFTGGDQPLATTIPSDPMALSRPTLEQAQGTWAYSVSASGRSRGAQRFSHNTKLKDIATVHRRTGVTSEVVFWALSDTAVGVARLPSRQIACFQSTSSAISSMRRAINRREAIDTLMSDPAPP